MFQSLKIYIEVGYRKISKFSNLVKLYRNNLSLDDLDFIYELFTGFSKKIYISTNYMLENNSTEFINFNDKCSKFNDFNCFNQSYLNAHLFLNDKSYLAYLLDKKIDSENVLFYGFRKTNDLFSGISNDFNEKIEAIKILINNNIKVKVYYLLTKESIKDLKQLEKFQNELNFELIFIQPKPIGEAFKNIAYRLTKKDLKQINSSFDLSSLGISEEELYKKLIKDERFIEIDKLNPSFYIDNLYNCYMNNLIINKYTLLGNLKKDSVLNIINNYNLDLNPFLKLIKDLKIKDLVKEFGNEKSNWIFTEEDYILYLIMNLIKKLNNKE